MKKNSFTKATLFFLTLAVCFSLPGTMDLAGAAEPALPAVTGEITGLHGTVITLDKSGVYYPISEMRLPAWAKVGEKATLLYERKGYTNYYYKILKPGQKVTTLENPSTAKVEER
jgi:hypothetical protein